jgi:hypothetical protein
VPKTDTHLLCQTRVVMQIAGRRRDFGPRKCIISVLLRYFLLESTSPLIAKTWKQQVCLVLCVLLGECRACMTSLRER